MYCIITSQPQAMWSNNYELKPPKHEPDLNTLDITGGPSRMAWVIKEEGGSGGRGI